MRVDLLNERAQTYVAALELIFHGSPTPPNGGGTVAILPAPLQITPDRPSQQLILNLFTSTADRLEHTAAFTNQNTFLGGRSMYMVANTRVIVGASSTFNRDRYRGGELLRGLTAKSVL